MVSLDITDVFSDIKNYIFGKCIAGGASINTVSKPENFSSISFSL